jgi:hypothetical protein
VEVCAARASIALCRRQIQRKHRRAISGSRPSRRRRRPASANSAAKLCVVRICDCSMTCPFRATDQPSLWAGPANSWHSAVSSRRSAGRVRSGSRDSAQPARRRPFRGPALPAVRPHAVEAGRESPLRNLHGHPDMIPGTGVLDPMEIEPYSIPCRIPSHCSSLATARRRTSGSAWLKTPDMARLSCAMTYAGLALCSRSPASAMAFDRVGLGGLRPAGRQPAALPLSYSKSDAYSEYRSGRRLAQSR